MDEPPATPPPDPQLPEPPQPGLSADTGRTVSPRSPGQTVANPNAGWLVLVGGVLVIVGVFLPWLTVSRGTITLSAKGSDLAGWGFYILGGFAIVRGLSMAKPDRISFRLGTPLIGGIILAVLVASHWTRLRDDLEVIRARGADASIGIGYWIVVAGTACVLLGGVLAMRRRV